MAKRPITRFYGELVHEVDVAGYPFWVLRGEPNILMRAKRWFGRMAQKALGEVRVQHTGDVALDLEAFLFRYPIKVAPEDAKRLRKAARDHRETLQVLEDIVNPSYQPREFKTGIPARDYQRRAAEIMLIRKKILLGDDVGTGKTATALTALLDPVSRPAVVVTKAGTLPVQWKEEAARFVPDAYVHIISQMKTYPIPADRDGRPPDIYILTYAKLSSWADTLGRIARTVIFDECQELRHSGSFRYDGARVVCEKAPYRWGLSATPIHNYGGEIFNVLAILNPDALGTHDEFLREWCVDQGRKHIIADPKAFGAYLRENFLMIRRTRKDVGRELPPLSKIPQYVEADDEPLNDIKGAAAELAKVLLSRADVENWDRMQAGGRFDLMLRQATGIAKARHVADFVRLLVEQDEPVLLYGYHRAVYDIWLQRLADLEPVMFTGSETPAQKVEARKRFMEGQTKLCIMSIRAGVGVDGFQKVCRTAVIGELDWSPAVMEQSIGRVFRDGQPDPVTAYIMLSDSGSDPHLAEMLGLKRSQMDGIRDPHADIIESFQVDAARVKDMARKYLSKLGIPIPAPPATPAANLTEGP